MGDVVLIAAGDEVPADGRIIAASALQIDESALTGESTPAAKDAETLSGDRLGPGDQSEHGVHEHAGHARQRHGDRHRHGRGHRAGEDLRDAVGHGQGGIAADQGAEQAHPVDRGGGRPDDDRDVRPGPPAWPGLGRAVRQRGLAGHRGHPRGAAHGDADDPVARRGRPGQAQRDREGPPLGGDARVHLGDQLRQDRHADDEPDDRRGGGGPDRPLHDLRHRLRPGGQGPSRRGLGGHDRGRDPAVPRRQRRQARGRQGRRRPHRGCPAGAGPQGRAGHRRDPRAAAPAGHPAVRPGLQADGHLQLGHRRGRAARSCGASSRARRRR